MSAPSVASSRVSCRAAPSAMPVTAVHTKEACAPHSSSAGARAECDLHKEVVQRQALSCRGDGVSRARATWRSGRRAADLAGPILRATASWVATSRSWAAVRWFHRTLRKGRGFMRAGPSAHGPEGGVRARGHGRHDGDLAAVVRDAGGVVGNALQTGQGDRGRSGAQAHRLVEGTPVDHVKPSVRSGGIRVCAVRDGQRVRWTLTGPA